MRPLTTAEKHAIVYKLFGSVRWKDDMVGYVECPAKAMHQGKSRARDCKVMLNGAPTIYCLHQSCSEVIRKANYALRKTLWDCGYDKTAPFVEITPEQRAQLRARIKKEKEDEGLRLWAESNKELIFKDFAWDAASAWEESPIPLNDPSGDWKKMLGLFDLNDIVWIGEPTDSGDHAKDHFRPVANWLSGTPSGHFTCPSTFKSGVFSRSNSNIEKRPYLVIESDTLTQEQTLAVTKWLSKFLPLRAVLYTGGKSIHSWFKFPSEALFEKLKIILPVFGCDPALFKASQPVRLAGVKREEKWQSLLWFQDTTIL